MRKSIISSFTIVAFMIFSISCYSTKAVNLSTKASLEGKELKIIGMQKIPGEVVQYPKAQSAQISRGIIIGNLILKEYVIEKLAIQKTELGKKGETLRITTKDGKEYSVATVREENEKIIVVAYEYSRIPLSEIDMIWIKKSNTHKIILGVLFGIGVAIYSLGNTSVF